MKITIKSLLLLLTGIFLVISTNTFAQKSIDLSYDLSVGDSYVFITDIDMDMTFEAMGTTATLDQLMGMQMTSVIMSIEGDEINQDFTIDKISMNQKIFGMEMNYDSEDSSTFNSGMGAQIAQEMNKVIGSTIKSAMDNKGNIIEIDMSTVSDNSDIANSLGSGNTFAVYPNGKVAVGESWETDLKPTDASEMKVHNKYTLMKLSRKQAVISVEGTLSANEISGQEINLSGATVGEMVVDVKTGMLITSTIDLEMDMDIDQGGAKIPASMISTSITNVTKIE